jgi:hypothetical protein
MVLLISALRLTLQYPLLNIHSFGNFLLKDKQMTIQPGFD